MYKWIKHIVKSYEKMFTVEVPQRPVVYKIGTKKYIKKKQFSQSPVPRTRYESLHKK